MGIDPDTPDDPRELFQRFCREIPQLQDSYSYTYSQEGKLSSSTSYVIYDRVLKMLGM